MKMKAGVLTVCGAPRPFAKSKPIHVLEVELDPPGEGEVLVKVGRRRALPLPICR
jgi:alcohol dehydrogenase